MGLGERQPALPRCAAEDPGLTLPGRTHTLLSKGETEARSQDSLSISELFRTGSGRGAQQQVVSPAIRLPPGPFRQPLARAGPSRLSPSAPSLGHLSEVT